MLGSHMLLPQLRQRQRRPDGVSNLPAVQIITTEIVSDVYEQGALFSVRKVQIFDEDGPDLSLLFECQGVETEGDVDAGDEGFVDIARTVGG